MQYTAKAPPSDSHEGESQKFVPPPYLVGGEEVPRSENEGTLRRERGNEGHNACHNAWHWVYEYLMFKVRFAVVREKGESGGPGASGSLGSYKFMLLGSSRTATPASDSRQASPGEDGTHPANPDGNLRRGGTESPQEVHAVLIKSLWSHQAYDKEGREVL